MMLIFGEHCNANMLAGSLNDVSHKTGHPSSLRNSLIFTSPTAVIALNSIFLFHNNISPATLCNHPPTGTLHDVRNHSCRKVVWHIFQ